MDLLTVITINKLDKRTNMKMYKPDQGLVKRLLIKLAPLFFSYPESEQNKRRQLFDIDKRDQIYAYLYRELFDLEYHPDEENDSPLDDEQRHVLNAHTTALMGIGDYALRLCEFQNDEFDLGTFRSLYDYDVEEFEYQKQARKEHGSNDHDDRDYRLYLNHVWLRILDSGGHFYYSTLTSLSCFLTDELDRVKQEVIGQLIPHELVEGPEHGKNVDGGMVWDFQSDANGLEAELDELTSRGRDYINTVYRQLDEEFRTSTPNEVYFVKHGDDAGGPHWDVIVNNAETAKRISFTSFLADCQNLVQPNEQLEKLKEREITKLRKFLINAHRDILENFDPKVVKLKKKMTMVMSPGALDDLSKLPGDDDL